MNNKYRIVFGPQFENEHKAKEYWENIGYLDFLRLKKNMEVFDLTTDSTLKDKKDKKEELSKFKSIIETRKKLKGKAINYAQEAIEALENEEINQSLFLLRKASDYVCNYDTYCDLFPLSGRV